MKLPSYNECLTRMNKGTANPIHLFIIENEPAGLEESKKFREELLDMIFYVGNHRAEGKSFDEIISNKNDPNIYQSSTFMKGVQRLRDK